MKTAEIIDMSAARVNVEHMSKMIQIRNVPDDLHRELKMRAAAAGMSMSDYIKRELSCGERKSTIWEEIDARRQGAWRGVDLRPRRKSSTSSAKAAATDARRRRIGASSSFSAGRASKRRWKSACSLREDALWAPHLIDAEVGHALRRAVRLRRHRCRACR